MATQPGFWDILPLASPPQNALPQRLRRGRRRTSLVVLDYMDLEATLDGRALLPLLRRHADLRRLPPRDLRRQSVRFRMGAPFPGRFDLAAAGMSGRKRLLANRVLGGGLACVRPAPDSADGSRLQLGGAAPLRPETNTRILLPDGWCAPDTAARTACCTRPGRRRRLPRVSLQDYCAGAGSRDRNAAVAVARAVASFGTLVPRRACDRLRVCGRWTELRTAVRKALSALTSLVGRLGDRRRRLTSRDGNGV